jgi:thiol-disulfide isomerase/thioredoxin
MPEKHIMPETHIMSGKHIMSEQGIRPGKHMRLKSALRLALTMLAVMAMFVAASSCDRAPRGVLSVGDAAPDYLLSDIRDEKVSMSEFKGRVVLLEFWTTWCPTCRDSVPYLNALNKDYSDRGLVLMSVNLDDGVESNQAVRQDVRQFADKHKLGYRVLFDDIITGRLYDVNSLPTLYIIDKKQRIVKKYSGVNAHLINDIKLEIERLF